MKKYFPFISFLVLLMLDQWSKYLVRKNLSLFESVPIIRNIFHLTYIENTGVAFGLFSGKTWLFLILSSIILIGLLFYLYKYGRNNKWACYGSAFVVSGAIGNMIDRMMKASVTDMFDFQIWPIFNIADIAVCVGFILLAVFLFTSEDI